MQYLRKLFGQTVTAQQTSPEVKQFVDGLVQDRKVVVFSKTYCPYCTKAKQTFGQFTMSPGSMEVVELENRPDCDIIQDYLKEITGGRSVPRVFVGGKFLGGGDDTVKAAQTGELEKMLRQCGAVA